MKIYSKNLGYINIPTGGSNNQVTYLSQGGQASVYITNDQKYAIKIYHDPSNSIPEKKIKELSTLRHKGIVTPIETLYDNCFVGYYMEFVQKAHDLCELFPKAFKTANNIDFEHRKIIVEKMMDMVLAVHKHKFLIVDLNSNNVLVDRNLKDLHFIDTDSYQTHSFSANAIQDSIRDRLIKNNNFNEGSDWFSFACLAFNLYCGIHPYGGVHPKYTGEVNGVPKMAQRMNDGISVFDKDVKYSPSVDDFKNIPKRHYDWFYDVFVNKNRSVPPKADSAENLQVPTGIVVVKSSEKLNINEIYSFDSSINKVWNCNGRFIFKTKNGFYENQNKVFKFGDFFPVVTSSGKLDFVEANGKKILYKDASLDYDYIDIKGGKIFRLYAGVLYVDELFDLNRAFFSSKKLSDVSITATMKDGIVYEKCVGVNRLIAYNNNGCKNYFLKDGLEKYNILNAKLAGDFALIMAKKKNHYQLLYDLNSGKYASKRSFYSEPNIVAKGDVKVKIEGDKVSFFRNLDQVKVIDNSGLDDSCILFTNGSLVYFYTNNKFYSVSVK